MTDAVMLRRGEVERRLGVSRSWIYAAMDRGEFPRPIKIGPQAVRWRIADLKQWEASRPEADPSEDADAE